jgi:serine/threonine protein kinase
MLNDPSNLVDHTFAGYRLDQVLGEGGSGTVYLGVGSDGQKVAVKVLTPAFKVTAEQVTEFRRRFIREARLLERLEHPHILSVLASGEDEETGHVYMIMPYMAGGTLAARLASGPLPLADVVSYVTQVGEALDFANGQGVVHRDIKPSNVLLDEQGRAVLADFGIAKLVDALTTQLTMTSQIVGTPDYMAPEQIRNQAVTTATDVFGLGALAYHLLTGQAPFAGTSLPEIVQKVMFDAPTPVRQLRMEVPPPAESVVLKALAKDPAKRFVSAGALAQALAQGMRGEWPVGVQMPPPTPPTQIAQIPLTMMPPGATPPLLQYLPDPQAAPYPGYAVPAGAFPGPVYLPPGTQGMAPTQIGSRPPGPPLRRGASWGMVAIAAVVALALVIGSIAWIAAANSRSGAPIATNPPIVAATDTPIPTVAPTHTPTHTPIPPTNTPRPQPPATVYVASGGYWNFNDNTSLDNDQACLNDSSCIGDITMTSTTYTGAPAVSFNGQQYVFILDGDFTILDGSGSNYSITQNLSHWRWQLQRSFGDSNFQTYNNWDQLGANLTNGQSSSNSGDIWVHTIFHANPSDCQGNGTVRRLRFSGSDTFVNPNLDTNGPYADIYLVCQ